MTRQSLSNWFRRHRAASLLAAAVAVAIAVVIRRSGDEAPRSEDASSQAGTIGVQDFAGNLQIRNLQGSLDSREQEQPAYLDEESAGITQPAKDLNPPTEAQLLDLKGFRSSPFALVPDVDFVARAKYVIGPTAMVVEPQSKLEFQARVDTGAHTCSMHVEKILIQDEAAAMDENVGKAIRFKIKNHEGASHWIESIVECCTRVRTSDHVEQRYKVPLELQWRDLQRVVLVTLNDRNNMNFPLLLGRNFLNSDFVVDVSSHSGD